MVGRPSDEGLRDGFQCMRSCNGLHRHRIWHHSIMHTIRHRATISERNGLRVKLFRTFKWSYHIHICNPCCLEGFNVGLLTSYICRNNKIILPLNNFICSHGPLTKYVKLLLRRECRERFPRHRLQRKPLVSDPGMHHGTYVTHVPWCMSGSLTRSGGGNVTSISGACATRNFTYLGLFPWGGKSDEMKRNVIYA